MTNSAATASNAPPKADPGGPPAKYKRSIKNYLIDSRFQLKYTGYIILVAVVISAVLGTFLYLTSRDVVREGYKVVEESKKVSDVVRMNITKDPIYSDNPELAAAFASGASESDKKIEDQQATLVHQQQVMLYTLVGALTLMVVLLGILGIYITHKVAGPIYKMKMLLHQVGEGKLRFEGRLRKGDELQDFFEAFAVMVERLRARRSSELEQIEGALALANDGGAHGDAMAKMSLVRDRMKTSLDE